MKAPINSHFIVEVGKRMVELWVIDVWVYKLVTHKNGSTSTNEKSFPNIYAARRGAYDYMQRLILEKKGKSLPVTDEHRRRLMARVALVRLQAGGEL